MMNFNVGIGNKMKASQCISTLESILKDLTTLSKKAAVAEKEVSTLQKKLRDVDEAWKDGAIHDGTSTEIEQGQAIISDLLNDCHELASDLLERSIL